MGENIAQSILEKHNHKCSFNCEIANSVGLNESIVLTALVTVRDFRYINDMEYNNFALTHDEIKTLTTLSKYQQIMAIKKLTELKFIETSLGGIPAKNYYHINFDVIKKYLKNIEA